MRHKILLLLYHAIFAPFLAYGVSVKSNFCVTKEQLAYFINSDIMLHKILLLLYHAIFAPFLAYGVPVRGLTYPSLLNLISVIQKKKKQLSGS